MNDTSTYKVVEIVGSSPAGVTEAMENGIARASKTLRNVNWVEVTEVRGHVADGKIAHFQVGMKVGFTLEE
jgi:flavin-binding protein dodecin